MGFLGIHIVLFALLFFFVWRAKKVSAFFRLFMGALLTVLFISPLYMDVYQGQTNVLQESEEAGEEVPEEVVEEIEWVALPLQLRASTLRPLVGDGLWTEALDETTGIKEELFTTGSRVVGVVRSKEDEVGYISLSLQLDQERVSFALLDVQLLVNHMHQGLAQSGWVSTRVEQIRQDLETDYQDRLVLQGVVYGLEYDSASKKLHFTVEPEAQESM